MKTKIIWIGCSLLLFVAVTAKADRNRQLLCANFLRQAANSFELTPAAGEYKWDKGNCRYLTLERAETMYYLLTSCLQTKCGNKECRVSEKEFKNTSCPYAPDLMNVPDFLEAFAKEVDKYKGDGEIIELHATEMTRVPWCITSPDILRRAALGCENVPAAGTPMNARAER